MRGHTPQIGVDIFRKTGVVAARPPQEVQVSTNGLMEEHLSPEGTTPELFSNGYRNLPSRSLNSAKLRALAYSFSARKAFIQPE